MPINIIDNAHHQEFNVAMNQGMSQALDQINQPSDLAKTKRSERKDAISEFLSTGNAKNATNTLLQNFFSRAGVEKAGFLTQRPNREAERRAQDELKQLLGQKESHQDMVELTRSAAAGLLGRMFADKNEAKRELKGQKNEAETNQTGIENTSGKVGKISERDGKKQGSGDSGQAQESGEFDTILENENFKEIFYLILSKILKNVTLAGRLQNKDNQSGQEPAAKNEVGAAKEVVKLLNEYAGLFLEYLVSNDSEFFHKIKQLEGKLRQMGVLEKDLIDLQLAIKNQVREKISQGIKANMEGRFLTENKPIDNVSFERGAFDWIEAAFYNNKLGGWDFGNYQGNLQGVSDEMGQQALAEVAVFLSQELEKSIVKKVMAGEDFRNDQEIKEFIKLSRGTGFDAEKWLDHIWPSKKLHYGLNPVDLAKLEKKNHEVKAYEGDPLLYQNFSGGKDKKKEEKFKKNYFVHDDEDKDILVARLRALYLRRILGSGLKNFFETLFEIKKVKGNLFKLGIFTPQLDKQLKKEARVAARAKFFEAIKENLMERSTLYETKGTAFRSVEDKIKSVLKNAAKIGLDLSSKEFYELADAANKSMFEVGRNELENVYVLKQTRPGSKFLENKEKLLLKLLERLSKESQINLDTKALYNMWEEKYYDKKRVTISGI